MGINQKVSHTISNKQIEKLGDYFKNNLNKVFKNSVDKYLTAYIRVHWRRVVGPAIYRHSRVADISNGVVFLRAWPDTWVTEIKANQESIVSMVNAFAGRNMAKEIKFRPYDSENKQNLQSPKTENTTTLESKAKLNPLTKNEKEDVKNSLSKVRDKELKKVLAKYVVLSKQAQNYRRENLTKCKICGKFKGKDICDECVIVGEKKLKSMVVRLLTDLPYLGFADASKQIPNLTPDFFIKVRFEMIQRQAKKVRLKDGVTFEAKCLTMLYRSMPPEFLSDKVVMETLKSLRYDLAESGIFKKSDFKKSEKQKEPRK